MTKTHYTPVEKRLRTARRRYQFAELSLDHGQLDQVMKFIADGEKFKSPDDLLEVRGIGEDTVRSLHLIPLPDFRGWCARLVRVSWKVCEEFDRDTPLAEVDDRIASLAQEESLFEDRDEWPSVDGGSSALVREIRRMSEHIRRAKSLGLQSRVTDELGLRRYGCILVGANEQVLSRIMKSRKDVCHVVVLSPTQGPYALTDERIQTFWEGDEVETPPHLALGDLVSKVVENLQAEGVWQAERSTGHDYAEAFQRTSDQLAQLAKSLKLQVRQWIRAEVKPFPKRRVRLSFEYSEWSQTKVSGSGTSKKRRKEIVGITVLADKLPPDDYLKYQLTPRHGRTNIKEIEFILIVAWHGSYQIGEGWSGPSFGVTDWRSRVPLIVVLPYEARMWIQVNGEIGESMVLPERTARYEA